MKSWLQQYKIPKKVESLPKKELVVCHKQLLQKYVNCLLVKESHEIDKTWYLYIELKVSRVLLRLQLLRLSVIKKVISNLFLSFYLIHCKIFVLINKSFMEVMCNCNLLRKTPLKIQ
jgi:hypothetical protein